MGKAEWGAYVPSWYRKVDTKPKPMEIPKYLHRESAADVEASVEQFLTEIKPALKEIKEIPRTTTGEYKSEKRGIFNFDPKKSRPIEEATVDPIAGEGSDEAILG